MRGDPRRLQQLLLILLDNAVKYADRETAVQVSVSSEEKAAKISIRDQGAGIAKEDLPHVFDRFYRGAAARDQWSGGAGLGLPIARWIVEKHGGAIKLSSLQGDGTEVLVRFPLQS